MIKAWFVDFEPVKAKAAGATAFPGMPPETFATLPNRLTDPPLGPLPPTLSSAGYIRGMGYISNSYTRAIVHSMVVS